MKVLMLNGSCHASGCTNFALSIVADALKKEGVDSEIVQIGNQPLRDCIACGGCRGKNKCAFDGDVVNAFIEKAAEADGFVFGSPVYFAHPDGRVLSALDRIFYAGRGVFERKPCAVVAAARRAGTTATLDALIKYPTIAQMPLVSSSYWTMIHGNTPEEAAKDFEGVQTLEILGQNMAWLIKCIDIAAKNGVTPPKTVPTAKTNFIR